MRTEHYLFYVLGVTLPEYRVKVCAQRRNFPLEYNTIEYFY